MRQSKEASGVSQPLSSWKRNPPVPAVLWSTCIISAFGLKEKENLEYKLVYEHIQRAHYDACFCPHHSWNMLLFRQNRARIIAQSTLRGCCSPGEIV